ncbi:hypothetical protein H9W95_02945 [Flavobacterium lindanitolerans]|nr:hypothetical protein [Flavobacterium lindanitolerans]
MKKLILSAIMLTGVVAFAQETPKKATKEVVKMQHLPSKPKRKLKLLK